MTSRPTALARLCRFALAIAAVAFLAACDESGSSLGSRGLSPIPNDTLALMQQKGTSRDAPVLIRTYKQEAELEIWKRKPDGQYVYLKTFPMCRWSGQLGPKLREGDRQVPEGFYTITPGQMNPNSHYYLSFNVGYPNAYDRAHGASGGDIMVHGICSSAGCFSMTNEQIAEIYAIAREAFNGGQRAIQMQSMPFKMTAENLAKHRLDPHIAFWKMLKEGVDNFEVTKQEPQVGVCGRRYVFNATPAGGTHLDAGEPCPALVADEQLKADVAAKQKQDDAQVAELVAKGVKPVMLVYDDGGQNPVFYSKVADVSRPEGLANGPSEVVLDDHGKPLKSPAVQVASAASMTSFASAAKTVPSAAAAPALQPVVVASADGTPFYRRMLGLGADAPQAQGAGIQIVEPAAPQPADVPLPPRRPGAGSTIAAAGATTPAAVAQPGAQSGVSIQPASVAATDTQPFYKRWLGLGSGPDTTAQSDATPAVEPAAPQPADVPLPPRRQAANASVKPQASLTAPGKAIAAAHARLPDGFMAFAPADQ